MSELIILYDVPTKDADAPGSATTWRTRYSLSIKNLKFQVVWVELPDVEALAIRIGAPPTGVKPDGKSPFYTIPIIQDPSTGAVVSESAAIAEYLDKSYPTSGPMLIPAGTKVLQLAFREAVAESFVPTRPFFWGGEILNDATRLYLLKRLEGLGVVVKVPEGEEREKQWAKVQAGLGKINKWLPKDGFEFVMGSEPSFADAVLCAFLRFTRGILGRESPEWKDLASWHDGRWGKLMDRFSQYE